MSGNSASSTPAAGTGQPVTAIKDLMEVNSRKFAGLIKNVDDFCRVKEEHSKLQNENYLALVPEEDRVDLGIDPNQLYPLTDDDHVGLVRELFEAISDFSTINTDNYQTRRVRALKDIQVELIAWEVLEAVKEVHNGRLNVAPWAGEGKRDWNHEKFYCFADRFLHVRESLKVNKSLAYNVLATPFVKRLAAAPAAELKSKSDNKVLNNRKAERLAIVKNLPTTGAGVSKQERRPSTARR